MTKRYYGTIDDADFCESCGVMEAVTSANNKSLCYKCAKKQRKSERKGRDKYDSLEESFDNGRQHGEYDR